MAVSQLDFTYGYWNLNLLWFLYIQNIALVLIFKSFKNEKNKTKTRKPWQQVKFGLWAIVFQLPLYTSIASKLNLAKNKPQSQELFNFFK